MLEVQHSISRNENIRDVFRNVTEFKKGYQPRANLVKDERGDLLADPRKILNRENNHLCQLLLVGGMGDVMQTEMLTAEPSASEVEGLLLEIWKDKLPSSQQIPAGLIQAGGGGSSAF
jgi:hypothetical protein